MSEVLGVRVQESRLFLQRLWALGFSLKALEALRQNATLA